MTRILVVEQNTGVRELLSEFFRTKATRLYRVATACTTAQARTRVTRATPPYDLIITANLFSDGLGTELIEWLKRYHPNIPVVLISGGLKDPVGHKASAFVHKPFDVRKLDEIVQRLLAA